MFSANSRYASAGTYSARMSSGATVTATRLPIRARPAVRGFHQRSDTQRPDLIAAHYLGDATAFWRLCDVGDALAPDALAARELVAIPGPIGKRAG
ncbi:MAG: LysM domain-containing protein [Rhodospirillales bacterium]|nr:LysM domain-containing protein [Rhodospirillales bacterium]